MRKVLFTVVLLGVLLAAVAFGRKGYRYWKQEHLVAQARYFLSKSDTTNAMICLQQAVRSNPNDLAACRLFAEMAEAAHSRNAVFWRRRIAELEPNLSQNQIDWAKAALVIGDLAGANEALLSVNAQSKKTAEYYKTVGSLAWALHHYPEAETNFVEASKLEPDNPVSQLNLAIIELISENVSKVYQGRALLERLQTNAQVRTECLRQLANDASHRKLYDKAASYAAELEKDPQHTFSDRLLYLTLLHQAGSPRLKTALASLQTESSKSSLNSYDVAKWMFDQGNVKEALAWLETLPPGVQTNLPVPLVTAECHVVLNQWPRLQSTLQGSDWKDLDYLRHGFYARALRAQGKALAASVEWRGALKESGKHLEALNDLVRRTSAWGWDAEMEETLWAIIDNFPMEKGAFLLLYNRLFAAGNTPALQSLLTKTSAVVPGNNELKNNLAIVTLLLNARDQKGHDLASEIYKRDSKNPFCLSTYAYSLFLQHKAADALQLFSSLTSQQLADPAIAAYYGVILSGSGKAAKAKPYLELAQQAKLLPEERILIQKAKEGV
jgi:cytochrome c-type biogenesis protein CcmH/NrfG